MKTQSARSISFFLFAGLFALSDAASSQCHEWSANFRLPGPSGIVRTLIVHDDGDGPALYVGGDFTDVEGMPANHVARWEGFSWRALGLGVNGTVESLCSFDDGTGPALYASGSFDNAGGFGADHIARWKDGVWTTLAGGLSEGARALSVFDDGAGPSLIAGGFFIAAGGMDIRNIARWDGSTWSALGSGLDHGVWSLASFDDGSGPALYAGGEEVSKWDGSTWSMIGPPGGWAVMCLTEYDDGTGPSLHAATNDGVQRWNGTAWSPCGSVPLDWVETLAVLDEGTGPYLCAGGFGTAGTFAKWNGTSWSSVGNTDWFVELKAFTVFDDGNGARLYAGTAPLPSGYDKPQFLGKWNESTWTPLGRSDGMSNGVDALVVFDDGNGPGLYAGGSFSNAGSTAANRIARFDGEAWSALGSGIERISSSWANVHSLAVFDDGSGLALIAGGDFDTAGGQPAMNIARWDGSSWWALGEGVNGGLYENVRAMIAFDDGTGLALFVGGTFIKAGGTNTAFIAKWDGSAWSPVGGGTDGAVNAMIVFDDGTGPKLYVRGDFSMAGGTKAEQTAKWDGSVWSAVGDGLRGTSRTLAVFDDGSGPALFAGGDFVWEGITYRDQVAKWKDPRWAPTGTINDLSCGFAALTVFDDGSGPALFGFPGGCDAHNSASVFKGNGSSWWPIGSPGLIGPGYAKFAAFQSAPDRDPTLFVCDSIPSFGWPGRPSGITEWKGCGRPGIPFCLGDGTSASCPCGNSGGPGRGCENSDSTGGASLEAAGRASPQFDSLRLTCSGVPSGALAVFLQGTVESAPTAYGDGLLCTSGRLRRLFTKASDGGVISAPRPGGPSISARSLALGDPLYIGSRRNYQVFYRDSSYAYCPSPRGRSWNISSGLQILWNW